MNRKSKLCLLFLDFVIVVLAWGGFYRSRYGCEDSLLDIISPGATREARLSNYRWGGYLVDQVMYRVFHVIASEHFKIAFSVFLLFLVISLYLIQLTFWGTLDGNAISIKYKIAFIAATSLIVVNVIFSELFYFTDSFSIFEFMMLFLAIGCYCYAKERHAAAFICFLVTASFYQVGCTVAAILVATYVYLSHDGKMSRNMFLDELKGMSITLGSGAINLFTGKFILKIFDFAGIHADSGIETGAFDNQYLPTALSEIKSIYENSLGLLPSAWLPFVASSGCFLIVFIALAKRKDVNRTLTFLLWKVVSFILVFAIDLVEDPSLTPRTIITFYAMQAMSFLVLMYYVQIYDILAVKSWMPLAPVGYLLLQVFFIQIIISNRMVSNTLDYIYANAVIDYIEKEENRSGTRVIKFGYWGDGYAPDTYDEVHYAHGEINARNYRRALYSLIEINARDRGRHFEYIDMDTDIYQMYFEGKDWNKFNSEEQIVIVDDTAYVCVF